jgi:hypothetical protein
VGVGGSASVGVSGSGGASTSTTTSTSTGGGGGLCAPNHDGTISKSEVPLAPGLKATFLTTQNVSFDTTGQKQGDGSRKWDFTGKLNGDHLALVVTQSIAGAWYASKYPGASYASKLTDSQDLLGVFEITDTALLLRGVVSPNPGPTQTQLVYDPPAIVLAFPITAGKKWSSVSTVSGFAGGVAAYYTENYQQEVDAHGSSATPFGSFDVLRVRAMLVRTVGVAVTTTLTHLHVAECFGPVATLVSQPAQPGPEFNAVAEIRRLSP